MPEPLCRICAISAARVLRRSDAGVVAVPSETVRPGHVMVVSATHARSFSDLKPVQADAFMSLVSSAAQAAEQASGAERYYVIRIGDKSPHLHFHLVPRVEGEALLAPHVFGDQGWARHVRADATPPADLFEKAFTRMLHLDSVQHRAAKDAGRLPASLVGMSVSLLAGSIVFAMAWPFVGPAATVAIAIGASTAIGRALDDRMTGVPVRWALALATGLAAGTIALFVFGWLRG
jgi:diadenosine tetraphosphate (Ap4A) HIT family hydrolase